MKLKILLLLFVIYFISCKEDVKITEAKRVIKEWTGKTIKFPEIESFCLINKDSLPDYFSQPKEYKILLYIDSTGCTTCRLRLPEWKMYVEELGAKIDFLFYFRPKNEKDLISILSFTQFNYPVYFDHKDELYKLNKLPDNLLYQCFLLDKNNKVLAIGNPTNNPKIWELYKNIITGEVSDKPPVTTVEVLQTDKTLTDLQAGKTSETVFTIKNVGSQPLVITMVESSCGCTVPEWEKQPIAPGKSTEIKVKITPEKQEYFSKVITVHCNTEAGQILLKVSGSVD